MCGICVTLPHWEYVIYTYFKYDDATEPAKNLKYVERYASGTNPLTYFEYLVLTQSMSSH